jgi:hypothetical protein
MAEKDLESGRANKIGWYETMFNQGVVTPEIEAHHYKGSGTEEDPYVVNWLPNDPRNPMQW